MRVAGAFVAVSLCASIAVARAAPPDPPAALDATLRARTLAGAHVGILAVDAAGIRRIAGALVADATRYDAPRYPPGWQIDDLPYGYAAVPGALGLNLNVAHVRVRPGGAPGAATALEIAPQTSAFTVENASITGPAGSDDTTGVARPWESPETIRITGSYPMGAPPSDDLEPAVPDPAAYAAAVFLRALAAHGVSVRDAVRFGATPPAATVVWTHRSQALPAILRDCWLPSVNLIAEQLLEELGVRAGAGPGDARARGLAAERAWLQTLGVNADTVTLADGSGLSSYDRVTPRALVAVLLADWRGPQRGTVLGALPVAGISGTLETTFVRAPLRGNVFAKTGSMNHARLLAGYLRARDGATVVFAIMINDWMDDSADAERALDAVRAGVLTVLAGR